MHLAILLVTTLLFYAPVTHCSSSRTYYINEDELGSFTQDSYYASFTIPVLQVKPLQKPKALSRSSSRLASTTLYSIITSDLPYFVQAINDLISEVQRCTQSKNPLMSKSRCFIFLLEDVLRVPYSSGKVIPPAQFKHFLTSHPPRPPVPSFGKREASWSDSFNFFQFQKGASKNAPNASKSTPNTSVKADKHPSFVPNDAAMKRLTSTDEPYHSFTLLIATIRQYIAPNPIRSDDMVKHVLKRTFRLASMLFSTLRSHLQNTQKDTFRFHPGDRKKHKLLLDHYADYTEKVLELLDRWSSHVDSSEKPKRPNVLTRYLSSSLASFPNAPNTFPQSPPHGQLKNPRQKKSLLSSKKSVKFSKKIDVQKAPRILVYP
ncbi:MAG: hypothetical protein DHS80DRAFT_21487 [Piptocephalis tieghemiana]|nr:MAG: hypothetical protein DHS80DRAFT_21487 [Piptocephalis tieghemiana]